MVSFLVAMNRVDAVDLVVDLVDVDLDVDFVDVDLDVDLVDVEVSNFRIFHFSIFRICENFKIEFGCFR